MAKKKRSRRQGLFSKAINAGFIALAFAKPLSHLFRGEFGYFVDTDPAGNNLIGDMTANMGADLPRAVAFYGPIGASIGLKMIFNFVRRKNPVR